VFPLLIYENSSSSACEVLGLWNAKHIPPGYFTGLFQQVYFTGQLLAAPKLDAGGSAFQISILDLMFQLLISK
jgi:hypothetical protein